MNVAFLIGPKGDKIVSAMVSSADNIKFFTYNNIQEMIKESTMRHVFFDRILFSENIVHNVEEDLTALNGYITEYSDNTSIVLVCKSRREDILGVFNDLFTSPLYTPVITDKVTVPLLLEFVKDDILAIKANYYTSSSKEVKVVNVEEPKKEKEVTKPAEKPVKKGFFASLFGGKKNEPPKVENQKIIEEPLTTVGKAGETVSKIANELPSESFTPEVSNSSFVCAGTGFSESDSDGNVSSMQNGLGSLGGENLGEEISPNFNEVDNLGIGDFGESHTDTGYLDDEEELLKELETQSMDELGDSGINESEVEEDESGDVDFTQKIVKEEYWGDDEEGKEEYTEESIEDDNSFEISLMLGIRGMGLTSRATSKGLSLAEKGLRVLIVDLDYRENGILSFINTERFYSMRYDSGIDNKKVYLEDGVSLVSNGYGRGIDEDSLVELLECQDIYLGYDRIILDCPLDCLDVINRDVLESSNVSVYVNGDKGSIASSIKYLATGGVFEDILFEKSDINVVNVIEDYGEDVSSLERTMIFGRGDWLSKLS